MADINNPNQNLSNIDILKQSAERVKANKQNTNLNTPSEGSFTTPNNNVDKPLSSGSQSLLDYANGIDRKSGAATKTAESAVNDISKNSKETAITSEAIDTKVKAQTEQIKNELDNSPFTFGSREEVLNDISEIENKMKAEEINNVASAKAKSVVSNPLMDLIGKSDTVKNALQSDTANTVASAYDSVSDGVNTVADTVVETIDSAKEYRDFTKEYIDETLSGNTPLGEEDYAGEGTGREATTSIIRDTNIGKAISTIYNIDNNISEAASNLDASGVAKAIKDGVSTVYNGLANELNESDILPDENTFGNIVGFIGQLASDGKDFSEESISEFIKASNEGNLKGLLGDNAVKVSKAAISAYENAADSFGSVVDYALETDDVHTVRTEQQEKEEKVYIAQGKEQTKLAQQKAFSEERNAYLDELSANANSTTTKKQVEMMRNQDSGIYAFSKTSEGKYLESQGFTTDQILLMNTSPEDLENILLSENSSQAEIEFQLRTQEDLKGQASRAIEVYYNKNGINKNPNAVFDASTFLGGTANTVVKGVNLYSKIVGGLLSAQDLAASNIQLKGVTDNDIDMYNNIKASLNSGSSIEQLNDIQKAFMQTKDSNGVNLYSKIDLAAKELSEAREINDFASILESRIDYSQDQNLIDNLGSNYTNFKDTGDVNELVSGIAETIKENPGAIASIFTISALEAVLTTSTGGVALIGKFNMNKQESINDYEAKYGTAPTGEALENISVNTFRQTILEGGSDILLSGLGKRALSKNLTPDEAIKATKQARKATDAINKVDDVKPISKHAQRKLDAQKAKEADSIAYRDSQAVKRTPEEATKVVDDAVEDTFKKATVADTAKMSTKEHSEYLKKLASSDLSRLSKAGNGAKSIGTGAVTGVFKFAKASTKVAWKALKPAGRALIQGTLKGLKGADSEAIEEVMTEYYKKKAIMSPDEQLSEQDERDLFASAILGGLMGGTLSTVSGAKSDLRVQKAEKIHKAETLAEQKLKEDNLTKAKLGKQATKTEEFKIDSTKEINSLESVYKDAIENPETTLPVYGEEGFNVKQDLLVRFNKLKNPSLTPTEVAEGMNAIGADYGSIFTEYGKESAKLRNEIANGNKTQEELDILTARAVEVEQKALDERALFGSIRTEVQETIKAREPVEEEHKVFRSMAQDINSVTVAEAESVREELKDTLTESQLERLDNHIAIRKSLDEVSNDIVNGSTDESGKTWKGLSSYINRNKFFVNSGNLEAAKGELQQLKTWRVNHGAKLDKTFNGGKHEESFIANNQNETQAMDNAINAMVSEINAVFPNSVDNKTSVNDLVDNNVKQAVKESSDAELKEYNDTRTEVLKSNEKKVAANAKLSPSKQLAALSSEETNEIVAEQLYIQNELVNRKIKSNKNNKVDTDAQQDVVAEATESSVVEEVSSKVLNQEAKEARKEEKALQKRVKAKDKEIEGITNPDKLEIAEAELKELEVALTDVTRIKNELIKDYQEAKVRESKEVNTVTETEDDTLNDNEVINTETVIKEDVVEGVDSRILEAMSKFESKEDAIDITNEVTQKLEEGVTASQVVDIIAKIPNLNEGTIDALKEAIKPKNRLAKLATTLAGNTEGEKAVIALRGRQTYAEAKSKGLDSNGVKKAMRAHNRSFNWIENFMVPIKSKGKNIIQDMHNALSGSKANVVNNVTDYIGRDLNEQDRALIDNFVEFGNEIEDALDGLNFEESLFALKDTFPAMFLFDEDKNLDQGVKDAIKSVVYEWVATQGASSLTNDMSSIRSSLGAKKDAHISNEAVDILGNAGTSRDLLEQDLGGAILKLLSIKADDARAPANLVPNLVTSLGVIAVDSMVKADVMKATPITNDQKKVLNEERMNHNKDLTESDTSEGNIQTGWTEYLTVKSDITNGSKFRTPAESIVEMSNAFKESKNNTPEGEETLFNSLFSDLNQERSPLFKVKKNAPETLKNSSSKLTANERKGIKQAQKQENALRTDLTSLFLDLPQEAALRILGKKDIYTIPKRNRSTQESLNNTYANDLEQLQDFVGEVSKKKDGLLTKFYYTFELWRNRRTGVSQNIMNPQGNKSHRPFIKAKGWEATLDRTNASHMNAFWGSFEEELGIETEADFLNTATKEDKPNLPRAVAIVRALQNEGNLYLNESESSKVDMQNELADIIANAGLNAMALDALVQIGRYIDAKENNINEFFTDAAIEIDGKTNGIIFSILQFGNAKSVNELVAKLAKGGLYPEGELKNVRDFAKMGGSNGLDSYQEISFFMEGLMNEIAKEAEKNGDKGAIKKLEASQKLLGILDKNGEISKKILRNIVKNPLMITNYGSALAAISDVIAEEFMDGVYESLENIVATGTGKEFIDLRNNLNTVIGHKVWSTGKINEARIERMTNQDMKDEGFLELTLTEQENNIAYAYIDSIYGEAAQESIKVNYKTLIENRTAFLSSVDSSYAIYAALREEYLKVARKHAEEQGIYIADQMEIPKAILDKIDYALRGVAPSLTPPNATQEEKFSLEHNTPYIKSERNFMRETKQNPFTVEANLLNANATKSKSFSMARNISAPGAGPGAISIQSYDGFVINEVHTNGIATFGVHDANYFSILDYVTGTSIQNQAFYDVNKMNGIFEEVNERIVNGVEQAKNIANKEGINFDDVIDRAVEISSSNDKYELLNRIKGFGKVSNMVTDMKDKTIEEIINIDQYTHGAVPSTEYKVGTKLNKESDDTLLEPIDYTGSKVDDISIDMAKGFNESLKAVSEEVESTEVEEEGITTTTAIENIRSVLNEDNFVTRYLDTVNIEEEVLPNGLTEKEAFEYILENNPVDTDTYTSKYGKSAVKDINILRSAITEGKKGAYNKAIKKALLEDKKFGSMNSKGQVDNSYDSSETVRVEDTVNLFDRLPENNKRENIVHNSLLRERVNTLAGRLIKPLTLKLRERSNVPSQGEARGTDIFITNMAKGANPKSGLLAQGVTMSTQEIFAHELNHVVFNQGLATSSAARSAIERMFFAAKVQLKPEDMIADYANATQAEKDGAESTYNYIFNNPNGNHLDEFAAYGTTNEQFIKALNGVEVRPEKMIAEHRTAYKNLLGILGYLVDMFSDMLNKYDNLNNDQKLMKLLDHTISVNQGKATTVLKQTEAIANAANTGLNYITKPLTGIVTTLTNTKTARDQNGVIGASVKVANGDKTGEEVTSAVNAHLDRIRDIIKDQRQSTLSFLLDEMIGRTTYNASTKDLARRSNFMIDATRKKTKSGVTNNVRKAFSTDVSEFGWTALNKVMIKLDIQSLNGFELNDVLSLIKDPAILESTISKYESRVKTFRSSNYWIRQSKSTGNFLVTGKATEKNTMLNSYNIANLIGVESRSISKREAELAQPLIDVLITLYALRNVDSKYKNEVATIFENEMNVNSKDNGVSNLINMHTSLIIDARKLFGSDKEYFVHMIKGYTKEDYNAGVGMEFGTKEDHNNLLNQGYIRGAKVERDPSDPLYGNSANDMWIYIAKDGMLAPRLSGIMGTSTNRAKGANTYVINEQVGSETPSKDSAKAVSSIYDNNIADVEAMFTNDTNPDTKSYNHMIPIISPQSEKVVGYRYVMNEANKDSLLGKENDASIVLGSMAGSNVDKENSKIINREAIELNKKIYDENIHRSEESFLRVGPDSDNAELAEIYRLFPEDAKRDIKEIWGDEGMLVRNDLLTPMFGYRKASITSMFEKDSEDRNEIEKFIVDFSTEMLGEEASSKLRKAQNIWESAVQEVKDLIVVKSFIVTAMNIVSNTYLLRMNGLSNTDSIKLQYEGMTQSNALMSDMREKDDLEHKYNNTNDLTKKRNIKSDINRLQRRIEENPTYATYNAGLMPNIVDDVAADIDLGNNYRTKAHKKLGKIIDDNSTYLPAWTTDVAKGLIGSNESNIYRALNNLTMQSDFMARHALLKHNTKTESENKGSKLNAVEYNKIVGEVEEMFINFNAPTHKNLQTLNDIGLLWFTKYGTRVFRSVARTVGNNPLEVAKVLAVGNLLGMDVVGDSPITSTGNIPVLSSVDGLYDKTMDALDLIPIVNLTNG